MLLLDLVIRLYQRTLSLDDSAWGKRIPLRICKCPPLVLGLNARCPRLRRLGARSGLGSMAHRPVQPGRPRRGGSAAREVLSRGRRGAAVHAAWGSRQDKQNLRIVRRKNCLQWEIPHTHRRQCPADVDSSAPRIHDFSRGLSASSTTAAPIEVAISIFITGNCITLPSS